MFHCYMHIDSGKCTIPLLVKISLLEKKKNLKSEIGNQIGQEPPYFYGNLTAGVCWGRSLDNLRVVKLRYSLLFFCS